MSRGYVQSPTLKLSTAAQEATMANVLEALSLGSLELAESLLSRVSKVKVVGMLEEAREAHEGNFPSMTRVISKEFDMSEPRFIMVSSKTLLGSVADPDLPDKMQHVAEEMGKELSFSMRGMSRAWLIDAMQSSITIREGDVVSFSWKQRYGLS